MESELKEKMQESRILICIAVISFFLIAIFFQNNYVHANKEFSAIRIKATLTTKAHRIPKSWKSLLNVKLKRISNPMSISLASASTPLVNEISEVAIVDQSTEALARYLNSHVKRINGADLPSLEKNIEVAHVLISRVPDGYSAYKAKLISLLVKEAKFNQEIDDKEVDTLLETMATFNFSSDPKNAKEAILIAITNNEIMQLSEKISDIDEEMEFLELEYASLDLNTPEARILETHIANWEKDQQEILQKIAILERNLSDGELKTVTEINDDLVHIPFLRLLAKNEIYEVIYNANSFIDQFPNSPIGYIYIVKALKMLDREDDAITVILNSPLSNESLLKIQEYLEKFEDENPKDYWKSLKF